MVGVCTTYYSFTSTGASTLMVWVCIERSFTGTGASKKKDLMVGVCIM